MNRYALADRQGVVVNLVVWDGVRYEPDEAPSGWTPPDGHTPVQLADDSPVTIGDTIDEKGNVLRQAEPEPAAPTLEDRIAALEARAEPADPAGAVRVP